MMTGLQETTCVQQTEDDTNPNPRWWPVYRKLPVYNRLKMILTNPNPNPNPPMLTGLQETTCIQQTEDDDDDDTNPNPKP